MVQAQTQSQGTVICEVIRCWRREGGQIVEVRAGAGEQEQGSGGREDSQGNYVLFNLLSRKIEFMRTHDASLEEFKSKAELENIKYYQNLYLSTSTKRKQTLAK